MGSLLRVDSDKVIPSQDFVKENTVRFILESLTQGRRDELPPAPIVRTHPAGKGHVAIDGHNLLVVNSLLGVPTEVYVAEGPDDILHASEAMDQRKVASRNQDLREKFDSAVEEAGRLRAEGLLTIADLRWKYPFLRSMAVAKAHFGLSR